MSKRKKIYHNTKGKRFKEEQLHGNCYGYICSFVRGRDRQAKSELFELLKTYSKDLQESSTECSHQSSDESEDGDEDIDAALQAQIAKLKKQRKDERFKILDSGVNHMLFMKTDLNDHGRLVYNILEDTRCGTAKSASKCLLRLLPVLSTCRAEKEKIMGCIGDALETYGSLSESVTEEVTYKTEVKIRNNTDKELSSQTLIIAVGSVVKEKFSDWKVDLNNPKVHIFIDVLKTVCCVSIVHNYQKYRKFNLMELSAHHCSEISPPEGRVELKPDETHDEERPESSNQSDDKTETRVSPIE